MEHRGDERVGDAMARDVEYRDASRSLAAQQVLHDVRPALLLRLPDPALEVETLLEVDVDQVIAPDDAVQRERAAVNVQSMEAREIAGFGNQVLRDLLEVLQLVAKLCDHIDVGIHALIDYRTKRGAYQPLLLECETVKRKVVVRDSMQRGYVYYRTEPPGRNFDAGFTPDLTPRQMLQLGVFGGRYMTDCRAEFPASWYTRAKLCATKHDATLNYFGVNASQPLAVWRRNGWTSGQDPRGWFQW